MEIDYIKRNDLLCSLNFEMMFISESCIPRSTECPGRISFWTFIVTDHSEQVTKLARRTILSNQLIDTINYDCFQCIIFFYLPISKGGVADIFKFYRLLLTRVYTVIIFVLISTESLDLPGYFFDSLFIYILNRCRTYPQK